MRPPCVPWVKPVDGEAMSRAAMSLGSRAQVVPCRQVKVALPETGVLTNSLIDLLARHPLIEQDLLYTIASTAPHQSKHAG
jgi:hypothetical protein